MLSLTPPSKPEHTFDYSKVDLETLYTPPFAPSTGQAGDNARATAKIYNLDKEIIRIARPDSLNIEFIYGGTNSLAGRPKHISYDRGTLTFLYDTIKGLVTGIISPNGDSLLYQYDGQLPKNVRWTGSVNGNIKIRYNNDMKVLAETVNNTDSVNFVYDKDGLVISAGTLKLRSSYANKMLLSDTLGNVVTNYTYSAFGEISSQQTLYAATVLYQINYVRDSLGRIIEKIDSIQGMRAKYDYVYDAKGQLTQVSKNDTIVSTYAYDVNGNRTSKITPMDTIRGTCDAQDRLLTYGVTSYHYSANGDLQKRIKGSDTTEYDYNAMGNLLSVTLPDGTHIDYITDGTGRRIVRKVNGQITQRWLYSDALRINAELDSLGNVVSQFVYATKQNVPEYVLRSGIAYRVVTDHLGSVRRVINSTTGEVVQSMDYDEFGNVIASGGQQIVPMGFAGGLYDQQTGLVRFGARDYDSRTGRWITKDPIKFSEGTSNLYGYVANDPINLVDFKGEYVFYEHFYMTLKVLSESGFDLVDQLLGASYSGYHDWEENSQEKENSDWHAQARPGQSAEDAKEATMNTIAKRLATGSIADLGRALHTVQDIFAPGHGFQVYATQSGTGHLLAELGLSLIPQAIISFGRDEAIEASLGVAEIYKMLHWK